MAAPVSTDPLVRKHQQFRLILLYHASKCQYPAHSLQPCPETQHFHPMHRCAHMKSLWQHITTCSSPTPCPFPHCTSTKFIVKHFNHCQDQSCLVCSVVKRSIYATEKMRQEIEFAAYTLCQFTQQQPASSSGRFVEQPYDIE